MEKEIIKFICGLCFAGIVPVILIRQLRKGAVFSGTLENQRKILYYISIISISIISAIKQNSEILMGTLIGCAIFQLLGICGVNKLNKIEEKREEIPVRKVQYLIFCTVLLLFLSADYLLRGMSVENILNQIDGGLLIFLFGVYFYLTYGKEENSILYYIHFCLKSKREKQNQDSERKLSERKIIFQILIYAFLAGLIIVGNYLLFESISKIAVNLKIIQYSAGLTLVTWSINLLGILIGCIEEKNDDDLSDSDYQDVEYEGGEVLLCEAVKDKNNIENIIEGIIFSLTLLLGSLVLIKPIMTHIYIIYDLIILGIITILFQFISKIDNRLAGSSMATIYIGFIIYIFMR